MSVRGFWTKQRDDALRALAAQGKFISEIQVALEAPSKMAIRAHGNRLGITFARAPSFHTTTWTEAQEQLLRTMAAEGLSASDICAALGHNFTRNAVIGKARRMEIQLRGLRWNPDHPRKPNKPRVIKPRVAKPKKATEAERVDLMQAMATVEGITLDELNDRVCNFPVTPDVPFKFCGRNKHRGRYCEAHWVIAHQTGTMSRL